MSEDIFPLEIQYRNNLLPQKFNKITKNTQL